MAPSAHRPLTLSLARNGAPMGTLSVDRPIIKIGRTPESHLVLDDPSVARIHAVIEVAADDVVIIDLGTSSGTFVNDQRTDKWHLAVGDVIGIGPFRVRLDAIAAAAPAPEEAPAAPPAHPACARCAAPLREAMLSGAGHAYRDLPIRALSCPACAVTYVDVTSLEQKLQRRVRLTGTAAERSRKHGRGLCPLCRTSLDRVALEWGGSWATVEECPACGLLALEQGELAVIERLVAVVGGGAR